MKSGEKSKGSQEENITIAIGMGSQVTIQCEGEATSQIIQAYEGVRYNSNGVDLEHRGRSLKEIKQYKINEKYIKQNVKQQAGFDAELIDEARRNKVNIRLGSNERVRTSDGIGQINNTKYDHVVLDSKGNIIEGSESQMKFYGTKLKGDKVTYRIIDKIVQDESWSRYDTLIDIPAEQYEGAKNYAKQKEIELREQASNLRKNNEEVQAKLLEQKANSYEQARRKIRKSTVETKEAIQARLNPEWFVTKEVIKDINHAGVETAKGAILVSSVINTAKNIYSIMSEEKTVEDAISDISMNIAKTGVVGYGLGVAETSIKTVMHSSKQELIRRCGNSSLPTVIATGVVEVTKSLKRYAQGEISENELFAEFGEKGVGMVAAGYGATVGTVAGSVIGMAIPIVGNIIGATVGSFVGSMMGYTISSALYNGALHCLKMEKISESKRMVIEKIAKESIQINNDYIDELDMFLVNSKNIFREKIWSEVLIMKECILKGNTDKYIEVIEKLGQVLNLNLEYKTLSEFDCAMNTELSLTL